MALILTQEQMEYLGNAQKAIGNILDSCQALEAGDKGTEIPPANCIFDNCWQSCGGTCVGCSTCKNTSTAGT